MDPSTNTIRLAAAPPPPAVLATRRSALRRPVVWLGLYGVALGLIAFWPQHIDKGISPFLSRALSFFPLLTYERLEFGANIALFVPLGFLLAILMVRRLHLVMPIAFLTTLLIESVQAVLLPGRTPSVHDMIANTAGACIGLLLATLFDRRRPTGH